MGLFVLYYTSLKRNGQSSFHFLLSPSGPALPLTLDWLVRFFIA
jgi:hypothetical protein